MEIRVATVIGSAVDSGDEQHSEIAKSGFALFDRGSKGDKVVNPTGAHSVR